MDDAELVIAAREGTRTALAGIYDRYADRVHDVCFALLRDRAESAAATQQVFLTAAERIDRLRDPARLRAWLFAIARHESVTRLRSRAGTPAVAEVPSEILDRGEAVSFVWEGSAGLPARERALLDLALRQGLDGQDLADALGVSLSGSYVVLSNLRGPVERDLACYVLARRNSTEIPEVTKATQGWDGRFNDAFQKRVSKIDPDLVRRQADGTASPLALYSVLPLLGAPTALRAEVLDAAQLPAGPSPYGLPAAEASPSSPSADGVPWQVDGFPPPDFEVEEPGESRGPGAWLAVAALLIVLALIGGGLGYLLTKDDGDGNVAAGPDSTSTTEELATTTSSIPRATTTTNPFATTTSSIGSAATTTIAGATTTTLTGGTTTTVSLTAGTLSPPAAIGFGELSTTQSKALVIRNTGKGTATWSTPSVTNGTTVSPSSGTIPAGGSQSVTVSFNPNSPLQAESKTEVVVGRISFGGDSGSPTTDIKAKIVRPPTIQGAGTFKSRTDSSDCSQRGAWEYTVGATDDAGIASVFMTYGSTTIELKGASTTGFTTQVDQPATAANTDFSYLIKVTDVNGNVTQQPFIKKASGCTT